MGILFPKFGRNRSAIFLIDLTWKTLVSNIVVTKVDSGTYIVKPTSKMRRSIFTRIKKLSYLSEMSVQKLISSLLKYLRRNISKV